MNEIQPFSVYYPIKMAESLFLSIPPGCDPTYLEDKKDLYSSTEDINIMDLQDRNNSTIRAKINKIGKIAITCIAPATAPVGMIYHGVQFLRYSWTDWTKARRHVDCLIHEVAITFIFYMTLLPIGAFLYFGFPHIRQGLKKGNPFAIVGPLLIVLVFGLQGVNGILKIHSGEKKELPYSESFSNSFNLLSQSLRDELGLMAANGEPLSWSEQDRSYRYNGHMQYSMLCKFKIQLADRFNSVIRNKSVELYSGIELDDLGAIPFLIERLKLQNLPQTQKDILELRRIQLKNEKIDRINCKGNELGQRFFTSEFLKDFRSRLLSRKEESVIGWEHIRDKVIGVLKRVDDGTYTPSRLTFEQLCARVSSGESPEKDLYSVLKSITVSFTTPELDRLLYSICYRESPDKLFNDPQSVPELDNAYQQKVGVVDKICSALLTPATPVSPTRPLQETQIIQKLTEEILSYLQKAKEVLSYDLKPRETELLGLFSEKRR